MVYGDFLSCFPELNESITVWTNPDKSDSRAIPAIYIPIGGSNIKRRKLTSGNTALDIVDDDQLFIHTSYSNQISTGDYFCRSDKIIWRVVGKLNYSLPADFLVLKIEKVTGAIEGEHVEALPVKEGYFA